MIRLAPRFVRAWLLDPRPVEPLVAMRVIFGGSLLGAYLVRLPYFGSFYGADSIAWFGPYRAYVASYWDPPWDGLVRAVQDAGLQEHVWIAYALLLLSSACFCVGLLTRTSGFTALALHQFFWTLNRDTAWGWAMMISGLGLYVVLSRAGRHFSVDAWWRTRRRGRPAEPPPWRAPAWPLRLVQINVCTMYAVAGLSRLDNYDWHEGRMLTEALTNLLYARFNVDWTPLDPVLRALTYVVFVLEPAAPILLWVRPVAKWIALMLIGMHVGLELLTDIGWWNYVMIGALLSFLPTGWLASVFGWLAGTGRPWPEGVAKRSAR